MLILYRANYFADNFQVTEFCAKRKPLRSDIFPKRLLEEVEKTKMNQNNDIGPKPPAVPRRTQSAKIVSSYKSSKALRATNEEEEKASSRQPTRRGSQKNKTRRSLDAMEKQADDLFDFLSDLESKKASCSDKDVLCFLSDSKEHSSSTEKVSMQEKNSSGLSSRAKRMSVKDKAKLFLKPDIKEETIEDTSKFNKNERVQKTSGSNQFKTVNHQSSRNTNNNNTNIDTQNSSSFKPNAAKVTKDTVAKTAVTVNYTNGTHLNFKPKQRVGVSLTKSEHIEISPQNGSVCLAVDEKEELETTITASEKNSVDDIFDFSGNSNDTELSSEYSESLSEAELTLNSSSQSSSAELDNDQNCRQVTPSKSERLQNSTTSSEHSSNTSARSSASFEEDGSSENQVYDHPIINDVPLDQIQDTDLQDLTAEEYTLFYSTWVGFSCFCILV